MGQGNVYLILYQQRLAKTWLIENIQEIFLNQWIKKKKKKKLSLLLDYFRRFKKCSKLLGDDHSFRTEVSDTQEASAESYF